MVNPMWRMPKGIRLPAAPDHWCRPSSRIHLVSHLTFVCHYPWCPLEEACAFSEVLAWQVW